jgi:hypothetical protein
MEEAVLQILQPEHLREAAGRWEENDTEPRLISEVENFVYESKFRFRRAP